MNFVRPADFQQVFVIGFKRFETVMYEPIVENKVDDAIQADSCSHPKTIVEHDMTEPHQP